MTLCLGWRTSKIYEFILDLKHFLETQSQLYKTEYKSILSVWVSEQKCA